MKGATEVIMGATLITVVSLAIVSALILVLLLRWRHQLKNTTSASVPTVSNTTAAATVLQKPLLPLLNIIKTNQPAPLGASTHKEFFMHQGTSFSLLHSLAIKTSLITIPLYILEFSKFKPKNQTKALIKLVSYLLSPNPVQEISIQLGTGNTTDCKENGEENFVYISNPIYDNDASCSKPDSPFETPNSSPSHLENSGSSGDDEKAEPSHHVKILYSPPMTPPLSPIKKLPAQACSVS